MKKLISVTIPTRKRVPHLTNTLNNIIATANDVSRIEVLLRVDTDDEQTLSFLKIPKKAQKCTAKYEGVLDLVVIIGDRGLGYQEVSKFYNELAKAATGKWVWIFNDDSIFDTKGWDSFVKEKPDNKILLPNGNKRGWVDFPVAPKRFLEFIEYDLGAPDTYTYYAGKVSGRIEKIPVQINHTHIKDEVTREKKASLQINDYFNITKHDKNDHRKNFLEKAKHWNGWHNSNITIYVSTCNQHLHLIKIFAYLFNKFWGNHQEVIILGYDVPTFKLPDNFRFISMGKQMGGIEMWSTDLMKFFKSIDDEFFVWTTEDQFLISKINFDFFNKLILLLDEEVGRIGLTSDMRRKVHGKTPYEDHEGVIISNPGSGDRISATWSIWNREYLLKYLQPGQSPWDFEVHGSHKAKTDGHKILGTNPACVIRSCCAITRGKLTIPLRLTAINEKGSLDTESIDELKKLKFITDTYVGVK